MNKQLIQTPATLVDLDSLENNIRKYQEDANKHNKQLWPMLKTHKSTEITKMQITAGATGVLCGTLDEAEACAGLGIDKIMYAYPVASLENIHRVINLSKKCDFIIRLDDLDSAKIINEAAAKENVITSYTIIVDVGLHRFGVEPKKVVEYANKMKSFTNLKLRGISTHPGHVYSATNKDEVAKYVEDEKKYMKIAADLLKGAGFVLEYITSGSTPTFFGAVDDDNINIYHPGNYVFHDVNQMSIDTAKEDDCSLSVYATIISHPREGIFLCDAGSKCLGLDKGAHGNSSIVGYGIVKAHPELVLYSLSEEVGKIKVEGNTSLKVGDKIEIIPNHSCSSANLTDYLIATRNDEVVGLINVDIRGNSTRKNIFL